MANGFTAFIGGKDYFFVTSAKNKTRSLASKILQRLNFANTTENISALLNVLQKAKWEVKTLPDGRKYHEISGENFGGRGGFFGDGTTVIIRL